MKLYLSPMKRLILFMVVCTSIVACKKSDNGGPDLPLDHFTIGGTEYTATEYEPQNLYWGTGNGHGSGISFGFRSVAHPAGIYRMAKDTGADAVIFYARLRDKNGNIVATFQPALSGGTLTVSYSSGNMIISMPKAWGTNGKDSVEISAYVKEYL